MAEVSKIYLSRTKKEPRTEIDKGLFLVDFGLEGDAYSEVGIEKQVTVFFDESRSSLAEEPFPGLCFSKFLETVRIRGIGADSFSPGTKFKLGAAVFEVGKAGKKCYPECKIIQDNRKCALSRDVRFCRVLKTGNISKGDRVIIVS